MLCGLVRYEHLIVQIHFPARGEWLTDRIGLHDRHPEEIQPDMIWRQFLVVINGTNFRRIEAIYRGLVSANFHAVPCLAQVSAALGVPVYGRVWTEEKTRPRRTGLGGTRERSEHHGRRHHAVRVEVLQVSVLVALPLLPLAGLEVRELLVEHARARHVVSAVIWLVDVGTIDATTNAIVEVTGDRRIDREVIAVSE